MSQVSHNTTHKTALEAAVVAAKNVGNLNAVRWYLMIYPFGRKHLAVGLEREIERRRRDGETPIEYFAPVYVKAEDVDGKIVTTNTQLFENYVFVRASIKEIFRMKQYEERYNLPRRQTRSDGEQFYPFITDELMETLKWIARAYAGVIPVYVEDSSWLLNGDRVRLTSGPLKGIEATLFDYKKNNRKEIMVVIDNWMTIPLLHVKPQQYKVIKLESNDDKGDLKIDDEYIPSLHSALCRKLKGELMAEDKALALEIIEKLHNGGVNSDIMRCKLYSILLMAYSIIDDKTKQAQVLGNIQVLLPAIKAEQSKAILLAALYACTDNSQYYLQAHALVDPWKSDSAPKKSKRQLMERLYDYDHILGH